MGDDWVYREFTNRWNGEKYMDHGPSKEAYARWRARLLEIEKDPLFGISDDLRKEWESLSYMMEQ